MVKRYFGNETLIALPKVLQQQQAVFGLLLLQRSSRKVKTGIQTG